jgi:hypothetical protein
MGEYTWKMRYLAYSSQSKITAIGRENIQGTHDLTSWNSGYEERDFLHPIYRHLRNRKKEAITKINPKITYKSSTPEHLPYISNLAVHVAN